MNNAPQGRQVVERSRKRMKLLIVEDNHDMRRLIASLVGDLADAIYECSDGSKAVAAYETNLPDWVLMDIRMKEADGIAVTRAIRARWPAAQIMIVADYEDSIFRQAAHEAGASEYVVKDSLFDARRVLSRFLTHKS
jgi:CheY-like chemotaxis protein